MTAATPAVMVLTVAALAGGCATVAPPEELVTARNTYARVSTGPARELDPTALHVAKESLDTAEQAFVRDGDTQDTRDLAYVAERGAEIADARALAARATRERDAVAAQSNAGQTEQVRKQSAALGRANMQIESGKQALGAAQARATDAEARAAQAVADLARIASIRREGTNTIITLSGSVLFASNKAEILPTASAKLDDVAAALMKQDPGSTIVVQGFTDSRGSDDLNRDLSQRRAEVVRAYLVGHNVPAATITAEGLGAANPIADNASPEGRADNRRVQIVVHPAQP